MPLEALILDYGNVLSHPQPGDWFDSIAAQVGVQTNAFREAYWRHRHLYDAGLPTAEYWKRVLETIGHAPSAADLGTVMDRLVNADVASWTKYREEVWDLAESFRVKSGRTAFLSNGSQKPWHGSERTGIWRGGSTWCSYHARWGLRNLTA
jgi:putative hydrolase of the HAD superfamily